MKRRAVQILLALLVIIYRKTWFWWIFNQFSARFVVASREYFLILAFLELIVTFIAILYLLVFEGRKILELKWKWRYPVYLLLAYGVSYLSDIVFSFLTPARSNQMALNELVEMTGRQELLYLLLITCLLGPITEEMVYRGVLMNTFLKDSPWYGDVLLSACVFGYVHVSSGLTPLAFFTYASGGAISALLYRKTHSLYYPILLHIMINITAFWDLWMLVFS
ncbi:CPBP family intramembrane glutamic endopeptidase [Streptococcus infantis]|uniref:CPBP family intramembrane glutamic endopeptidase n=1 Tax=Streptococcus infantis TaxID=68892 RepID=UPI001CC117D3|nr:CPBP family intramembrane glutamic endopeptidase [Streptococcus infantis]MBZ2110050.1 CPBP family intramembrane metalloprotease [Streptococcus infantis]MBZ2111898.1 CPBP family intramembrane metalloprotease [Streptococcus infantis]MBZ2118062.1 CPBP family intramembrane metalloprotease [Streptococcus infantis]